MISDLSEASIRRPIHGLLTAADIGLTRTDPPPALVGRVVVLYDDHGTRVTHRFGTDTVAWTRSPGRGDDVSASGEDHYEAFRIADDLFYVQFRRTRTPEETISLALDFTSGHALSVTSLISDPAPGRPRVRQRFATARIEGIESTMLPPALSTALTGRRVLWEYGPDRVYEHIYLGPRQYTWQCLAGSEEGLADTDECTAYELRPGIFLFAWQEKALPCAAVTVADHRDIRSIRSRGVLFGLDEARQALAHFTLDGFGKLISTTVYPAEFDPAR
ncbi:MoaF C-terminal domain-containing protein [Spongiactinospora sp. TRM90649]|uniref:MoaF C-terminal domain-containing protein n=1 Tax=Spongiactinospora sp. TRM90649 TaxID=3031114 RepID=UPI0023F8472C|nr:MoaF C-terminal domain-containing protein [Spongiactinospora sp. TRM90649]MDF5753161.1 MoaF C-terminal domain-containing protein [Spongiactinospora sp. TRM90649]